MKIERLLPSIKRFAGKSMNMKDHNHGILSSRYLDEESSSWRRFRHLPMLAMTVLAVGYVVFQKDLPLCTTTTITV